MSFNIYFGYPDIDKLMTELNSKRIAGELSKDELKFHNKLGKTFTLLSANPKHNSLRSHEIVELSKKFRKKVFQSYLENKKRDYYKRIKLSNIPKD